MVTATTDHPSFQPNKQMPRVPELQHLFDIANLTIGLYWKVEAWDGTNPEILSVPNV